MKSKNNKKSHFSTSHFSIDLNDDLSSLIFIFFYFLRLWMIFRLKYTKKKIENVKIIQIRQTIQTVEVGI